MPVTMPNEYDYDYDYDRLRPTTKTSPISLTKYALPTVTLGAVSTVLALSQGLRRKLAPVPAPSKQRPEAEVRPLFGRFETATSSEASSHPRFQLSLLSERKGTSLSDER